MHRHWHLQGDDEHGTRGDRNVQARQASRHEDQQGDDQQEETHGDLQVQGVGCRLGFQCELIRPIKKHQKNPKPAFSSCHSGKSYTHLKAGRYSFKVRAVNGAGADPKPAVKRFKM